MARRGFYNFCPLPFTFFLLFILSILSILFRFRFEFLVVYCSVSPLAGSIGICMPLSRAVSSAS
jgi:hypothetical protein